MFGFFKRQPAQPKVRPALDYEAEFRRLTRALYDKFAVEDTPYDELLDAMAAIDNEMNRNGGGNWVAGDYGEYLDIIESHLLAGGQFTPEQSAKIQRSVHEIAECGRELETKGESSRAIGESIDYLVARVVDWCHAHPSDTDEEV